MELGEAVVVGSAFLVAFGLGIWIGFARGFKYALSFAEPIMNLAKEAKKLLGGGGGGKTGLMDIALAFLSGQFQKGGGGAA